MAIQISGNIGGTTAQPAAAQGSTPRPVAPQGAPAETAAAVPAEPSKEQVKKAVEEIAKSVSSVTSNKLQFSIDNDTGKTLVRVVDQTTGETIRQIPSEEVVELAKALDRMQGSLIRQQA
jgi:flagellar protein FlaG